MIALAALLIASSLPTAWSNWLDFRQINVPPVSQARLVRFALPVEVYGGSQVGLGDLRLISEAGAEVPYVVDTQEAVRHETRSPVTVSDIGFVPGKYTQAVADVGTSGELHNELIVEPNASESDFFEWAAIDASDDGQTWRIVREQAPIFRFESEGLNGRQEITFPQTRARWLRVRILDGRKAFGIYGLSIARTSETTIKREYLPMAPTLDLNSPAGKSWWTVDFNIANVPVSAVEFTASHAAFHRPVEVDASDDGATWNEAAEGDIYQVGGESEMFVEVPPGSHGRYWRLTVFNRSDAPITGLHVRLLYTPQYVVFQQEPNQGYLLIYGNRRATAPEYDFASLSTKDQRASAMLITAGPQSKNTAYVSPEPQPPWTERHAWIMWVALVVAIVAVGALAIRSMRGAQ